MRLTSAETSGSMRDWSATEHTNQPGFFSSGEPPILVIRSQFAGNCAHVAVTRGQEQKPASADSSVEGPGSGKDCTQSLFYNDANAGRESSENQA